MVGNRICTTIKMCGGKGMVEICLALLRQLGVFLLVGWSNVRSEASMKSTNSMYILLMIFHWVYNKL